jgi:copper oxidase (laccase) domain-containing protein
VLPGGARVVVSTRDDGDMRPSTDAATEQARRYRAQALCDLPIVFARQVHGRAVHLVTDERGPIEIEADALVTRQPGVALGVLGADCALVGLSSAEGVIGAVHAGWRGLLAGVLEATAAVMRAEGATMIWAACGPFIRAECYPFGETELALIADNLGQSVRADLGDGRQGLDMEIALGRCLVRAGIAMPLALGGCTHCESFFSERTRHDRERHALVIAPA